MPDGGCEGPLRELWADGGYDFRAGPGRGSAPQNAGETPGPRAPAGRRPALRVDTFLLSCRALGRGVEHRMVARLGEIALERGLETVEIPFVPGQRNRPAALFLESLCAPDGGGVFRLRRERDGRAGR